MGWMVACGSGGWRALAIFNIALLYAPGVAGLCFVVYMYYVFRG